MKTETSQLKYDEWALLKQEVNAFKREYHRQGRTEGTTRVSIFAIGAPRNFVLVVQQQIAGKRFYKRLRRDIRAGSHQFWFDHFDKQEWERGE